MRSAQWQKQHSSLLKIVWTVSGIVSTLVIIVMLALGFGIEVAGVFFILVFVMLRVTLAYIFKNRFGDSLLRLLKFDYEELERDFRFLFKEESIRYLRTIEEEVYYYEFPGYNLTMTVEPFWVSADMKPATKVTLHKLNAENEAFAEKLAGAIDAMADQRAGSPLAA